MSDQIALNELYPIFFAYLADLPPQSARIKGQISDGNGNSDLRDGKSKIVWSLGNVRFGFEFSSFR